MGDRTEGLFDELWEVDGEPNWDAIMEDGFKCGHGEVKNLIMMIGRDGKRYCGCEICGDYWEVNRDSGLL